MRNPLCVGGNICVENYFLVPLRELFRDGYCKWCYLVGTHPLGII